MEFKIGKCTCSSKDIWMILAGCAVGAFSFLAFVGGFMAQGDGRMFLAWLGYAVGFALVLGAKMTMWMGMKNGCSVHSMHGMMAMMNEKPKNGKRKR